jgi:predicted  nucleic acid-binding Zn-ribbon protein
MTGSLDDALRRLDGALGLLEVAVTRRLDSERRRSDLETELQIMQDDRARLAVDLDGATARLGTVEAVTEDLGKRVTRALTHVAEVLARAETRGVREV